MEIEKLNNTISFINSIEKYKTKSILYCNDMYKNLEKKDIRDILILSQKFYKDCLNLKYGLNIEYYDNYVEELEKINKKNDTNELVAKMKILNESLNLLKYNLNTNLFIDRLFIEFGRVYNE